MSVFFATYDTTGRIRQVGECLPALLPLQKIDPTDAVLETASELDGEMFYVDVATQAVLERPILTFDRSNVESDDTYTATLTGLPDPCPVLIDGVEYQVTGGELEITSPLPATYHILIDEAVVFPAAGLDMLLGAVVGLLEDAGKNVAQVAQTTGADYVSVLLEHATPNQDATNQGEAIGEWLLVHDLLGENAAAEGQQPATDSVFQDIGLAVTNHAAESQQDAADFLSLTYEVTAQQGTLSSNGWLYYYIFNEKVFRQFPEWLDVQEPTASNDTGTDNYPSPNFPHSTEFVIFNEITSSNQVYTPNHDWNPVDGSYSEHVAVLELATSNAVTLTHFPAPEVPE